MLIILVLLILCFPIYYNVYAKHCQSYKKMSVNEIEDFIFENYYKRIGFSNENSYYSMKSLKKEYLFLLTKTLREKKYQILAILKITINQIIYKKKHRINKTTKKNYSSIKNFWNPNIVDIKSVIAGHPRTLQKLSKTIRQAEK